MLQRVGFREGDLKDFIILVKKKQKCNVKLPIQIS